MHFTYIEPDKSSLKQGDILERTPALVDVLNRYHRYYAENATYTHFQILTQSCDLVPKRRGPHCKARYISLAAIRDISDAIDDAIEDKAKQVVFFDGDRYVSDNIKSDIREFLISLINNNVPTYFFLKACPERSLLHDSCTYLRLSVALQADEHYGLCVDAKRLELRDDFKSKFGWLVGDLYSRVGTQDYIAGAKINKNDFNEYVDELLSGCAGWVPKSKYDAFSKLVAVSPSLEEIYANIDKDMQQKRDSKLNNIVGVIGRVVQLTAADRKQLKNALSQNAMIRSLIDVN